jgi:hypothetical protein
LTDIQRQECMVGFVFPAEGDARNLFKQVSSRKEIKRSFHTSMLNHVNIY